MHVCIYAKRHVAPTYGTCTFLTRRQRLSLFEGVARSSNISATSFTNACHFCQSARGSNIHATDTYLYHQDAYDSLFGQSEHLHTTFRCLRSFMKHWSVTM